MDDKKLDILNSIGEVPSVDSLRMILYGQPGAGKTTTAAKLIENQGLFVCSDSGHVVTKKLPQEQQDKIKKHPYKGFTQISGVVEAHKEGIEPWCNLDTLIWDTASTGIDLYLRYLVKDIPLPKDQYHKELEGRGHFNLVSRRLRDTVDTIRDSSINIIFLCHIRFPTEDDKNNKKYFCRPSMPEACYNAISQEVQATGYIYRENKNSERMIQFEPTLTEAAKVQLPGIEEKTYRAADVPKLISDWRNNGI